MSNRHTFLDTLADLERRAVPSPRARGSRTSELSKLAETLRKTAEAPIGYDELYAVRQAGYLPPRPAARTPPDSSGPGGHLRKLAHEVRLEGQRQEQERFTKAAHILSAAEGLTLLADLTRSPS